ncbi:hypothetical protein E2562_028876 [Oryza meyeriana var. granulata]|uniref:Uncharacterized protein n=1 Tax=Oryza meyeriana var. granulata TaxID=110450 RepID=A0A6G1FDJ1_9ORYZ|nr:hypothetical protein E2562_028876 [Oryza meyeriana var. granulata]
MGRASPPPIPVNTTMPYLQGNSLNPRGETLQPRETAGMIQGSVIEEKKGDGSGSGSGAGSDAIRGKPPMWQYRPVQKTMGESLGASSGQGSEQAMKVEAVKTHQEEITAQNNTHRTEDCYVGKNLKPVAQLVGFGASGLACIMV